MKTVPLNEVKQGLSHFVDLAQNEVIVITRHGRPAAYIRGCEGMDVEDVFYATDPDFRRMLDQRRNEPVISAAEVRRQLREPAEAAPTRRASARAYPKRRK